MKRKYLSCVADRVIKENQNINAELLIGANFTNCWCTVGIISCRNQSEGKVSCNWLAVTEADSNKVGRRYFSVESKATPDKYVKSMLKKTYE